MVRVPQETQSTEGHTTLWQSTEGHTTLWQLMPVYILLIFTLASLAAVLCLSPAQAQVTTRMSELLLRVGNALVPAEHSCSVLEVLGHTNVVRSGEHYDSGLVELSWEASRSSFVLSAGVGVSPGTQSAFPLGRQHELWSEVPRLRRELGIVTSSQRRIRVAAVAVVVFGGSHVLLTRRSAGMRSFPNCWVLPGGVVEPGESLVQAAIREVAEETGLVVTLSARPLACWESALPLSPEGYAEARGLVSHILMVAFVATPVVSGPPAASAADGADFPPLKLQPDECDSYCWVGRAALESLLVDSLTEAQAATDVRGNSNPVRGCQLSGIYPNEMTPPEGLGLGHHFVLNEWINSNSR